MEITFKASHITLYLFVGFILFVVVLCSEEDAENPPEIFLEQYKRVGSTSWDIISGEGSIPDFLIKDGSDLIVSSNSSQTVSHLLLFCRASYPIYWAMIDVKPTLSTEIKTDFKVVLDFDDEEQDDVPVNTTQVEAREFGSYLILYNEVNFTGLYACQSVEDMNIQTNTYVFLPGISVDNIQILLQAGQQIMIGVNGQHSVVLPCKVSQPKAEVSVAKRDADGNWTTLTLKTKFDPKKGWTLHRDEVSPLTGQYKCGVTAEEFIIDVLNEYYEDEKDFPFKNDTSGEAKWELRESYIECCSNSTEAPELIVVECDNLPHCNMTIKALMNLRTNETPNIAGIEETKHYWADDPCVRTRKDTFERSFLIRCTGDGIDISGQFTREIGPPPYGRMRNVPLTSIQNISYSSEAVIKTRFYRWENFTYGPGVQKINIFNTGLYSGERLLIDCCGLHSYHATGRIQQIGWKNGTVTTMSTLPSPEDIDYNDRPYFIDFCSTYSYSYERYDLVTLEVNMSYFECIVPRWYTKYPGIQRFRLDVKASNEPVIFQNVNTNDEVNVTYSENQLGLLLLKCELAAGAPPPQVQWTKDGYALNQTDLFWSVVEASELTGINLLFMRATKEIEGKYECLATNWKGFDKRTFIVKVTPRSYLDYWIALVVFGGFFAMIICCGIRISTLEKQTTSKKQVEPLNIGDTQEIPGITLNEK